MITHDAQSIHENRRSLSRFVMIPVALVTVATIVLILFFETASLATTVRNNNNSNNVVDSNNDEDNKKVKVELYYESQCPGCRLAITRSFYEAFSSPGFLEMADVTFVPYGNAQGSDKPDPKTGLYEFQCQHGPSECKYNIIEACAIDKLYETDPLKTFAFLDCIEHYDEDRTPEQDYDEVAASCAALTKIPDDAVSKAAACIHGKEGNELEYQMKVKTDSLNPPHKYVPHIVVDGKHDEDTQFKIIDSLLKYVCNTYEGPNKSEYCPENSEEEDGTSGLNEEEKKKMIEEMYCYRDHIDEDQLVGTTSVRRVATITSEE